MAYAAGTKVPVGQSRAELERVLERYGADTFSYGQDGERAIVAFRANGRHVKFELPPADVDRLRALDRPLLAVGPTARPRAAHPRAVARARARREGEARSGRGGHRVVRAGVHALPDAADGTTAGEFLLPQVAEAYETGEMPSLLPAARPALGTGA
jgi:hypothetical protein